MAALSGATMIKRLISLWLLIHLLMAVALCEDHLLPHAPCHAKIGRERGVWGGAGEVLRYLGSSWKIPLDATAGGRHETRLDTGNCALVYLLHVLVCVCWVAGVAWGLVYVCICSVYSICTCVCKCPLSIYVHVNVCTCLCGMRRIAPTSKVGQALLARIHEQDVFQQGQFEVPGSAWSYA